MAKNYSKQSHPRSRNHSGNNIYSINYRFDSISIAGKNSGNALDLIKKYNELAKEAFGCHDIVRAEIFRQYAEHYRKIVTEINEKRNQKNNNNNYKKQNAENKEQVSENKEQAAPVTEKKEEKSVETTDNVEKTEIKSGKLKIVELKSTSDETKEEKPAPKRRGRPAKKKEDTQKEAS